ncbi:MAG: hypothetical protein IPK57_06100 [Chitinophagaceae bacterium]|nr:hypothetical protein [Chitinophagaceae bacterium]
MTWNSIMGFVSSFALFVPILLILILRLGLYRSFPFLLVYYCSVLVYNFLTEGYIKASDDIIQVWGLTNNLLDTPLILFFLIYFSTSKSFTQKMKLLAFTFILFEAIVLTTIGFNIDAITIIMGPGLLIVCGLCLYFFIRQAKLAVENRKATGKAVIITSLLFGYGCYGIIYLMYYIFKAHFRADGTVNQQYVADTFLVFFIATTLSSIIMCIGLVIERKRIQKLQELKVTRKELSAIYTDTKMAAPLRTAMLDFDRDQWN